MLNELGNWITNRFLGGVLEDYFSDKLEALGVATIVAALLASVLAIFSIKLLREMLTPTPDPRLDKLDPNNEEGLRQAFDDLGVVLAVSSQLSEAPADTLEEFRVQVKRLRLCLGTVWDRLNADDDNMMTDLFLHKETVKNIGQHLGVKSAKSVDELREQVRQLKLQKTHI